MKKYVLRSMVRAILDQPKVPRRYQAATNAEVLKRLSESEPRKKYKTRTLEERFWSRIVREDACWLWRGRSLTLSIAPGVIANPRRWAIERFAGGVVPSGSLPHPACGHDNCVNPEHQSVKRKGLSRLTAEQIAAIKADSRPFPAIAHEYGICRSYVSQIRGGKRLFSPPAIQMAFRLRAISASPAEPPPGR